MKLLLESIYEYGYEIKIIAHFLQRKKKTMVDWNLTQSLFSDIFASDSLHVLFNFHFDIIIFLFRYIMKVFFKKCFSPTVTKKVKMVSEKYL